MAIKHRGVKIVPVKITKYEVRDVSGQKLKTFSSASGAKHWIDGYFKAYNDLAPRQAPAPKPEPEAVETNGAAPAKWSRKRRDHIGDAPSA